MAKHGRTYRYPEGEQRPVSLTVRVPAALYDRLTQYASLHRYSLTEVVLEGIESRLETPADPREHGASDESHTDVLQQLEARLEAIVDVKIAAALAPQPRATAAPPPPATAELPQVASSSDPAPPFNTHTQYLGKLCPQGHNYAGTGQSLRNKKSASCVACNTAVIQARRHATHR